MKCTHRIRTRKVRIRKVVKQGDRVEKSERIHITRDVVRTVKAKKPQGVILYRGPSVLTGKPIVVVATGFKSKSDNPKTGKMIQVYILVDKVDPLTAAKTGRDEAICGDCPHRPRPQPDGTYKLGSCYVNLIQGPVSVWKAIQYGLYPKYQPRKHRKLFAGRMVRLGSYGNPAAVPLQVWEDVCSHAANWTGYTHAWRYCDPALRHFVMASVETEEQRKQAMGMGWRTFRVRLEGQPLAEGEFVCPASEEAGFRKTCMECKACRGSMAGGRNATPVIIFHGSKIGGAWKLRQYERTMGRILEEERAGRISLPTLN